MMDAYGKRSREDDDDEHDENKIREDLEYDEEDYDGDEEDVQDYWDDNFFIDDTHDSECFTSSQFCRISDVLKYYGFRA